jgi:adenylosuccinate synthase
MDVLDELTEIKICTGYRYKGSLLRSFPPDIHVLEECQPEYLTLKGWNQKTAGIQSFDELPAIAQDYLKRLADLVDTEVSVVSTGPDRKETIIVSPHSRLESWLTMKPKHG